MKKETRIAIVPGSFDPITNGHIDIIRRAAQKYDKVFVAVMINASKQYLFTMAQRKRLAELAVCHLENAEVIASEGMLWELARDLGACAIVKGYRNEKDLAYEQEMAEYNRAHYPDAETVLLPSDPQLHDLSSTLVRVKILEKEDLGDYLPSVVIEEIGRMFPRKI